MGGGGAGEAHGVVAPAATIPGCPTSSASRRFRTAFTPPLAPAKESLIKGSGHARVGGGWACWGVGEGRGVCGAGWVAREQGQGRALCCHHTRATSHREPTWSPGEPAPPRRPPASRGRHFQSEQRNMGAMTHKGAPALEGHGPHPPIYPWRLPCTRGHPRNSQRGHAWRARG